MKVDQSLLCVTVVGGGLCGVSGFVDVFGGGGGKFDEEIVYRDE